MYMAKIGIEIYQVNERKGCIFKIGNGHGVIAMKRFGNLNNNTKAIGIASTQKKEICTIFQIK
jgi:hypothetical protein